MTCLDVSPTQYGASPTAPAATNTAAFNAALEAAAATGSRLAIPGGSFAIDGPLTVTGDVPICGVSNVWTELVSTHPGPVFVSSAPGVRRYGWSIRDLRLTGPGIAGSVGVDLDSVTYADLQNLNVSGYATGVRIHSAVSGGAVYNRLYDVTVSGCGVGLSLEANCNATQVVSSRANACTTGVSIVDANDNMLGGCQIESNVTGLRVAATSNALADYNTVIGCRFETNTTAWVVASPFVRHARIIAPSPFGAYNFTDSGTRTQHVYSGYELIRSTVTNSRTLTAADALGGGLHSTAAVAVTVTLPSDSAAAIGRDVPIPWRQYGAGRITFAAGAGAVLLSRGSLFRSAGQYAEGTVTKVAANTWLLAGDRIT